VDVNPWLTAAFVTWVLVTLLWLLSLALRDSSIVDIFWGAGFVVLAWVTALRSPSPGPRTWVLLALVSLWGVRLAVHIFRRNRGRGEDYRYRAWREQAGARWWWWSYFKVFLLQGTIMMTVATPLVAALSATEVRPLGWIDAAGLLAWLIGFVFEALGDRQLARFKANAANRGRVLRTGVWRYTRHPNYFGDSAVWWGHYLVAAAAGAWWTVFSPALMTFLLVRVSGVAMLETSLRATKPEYADYEASTSAFFPWPPRDGGTGR
jgi:steroid 5-alpha reductase family enzyme